MSMIPQDPPVDDPAATRPAQPPQQPATPPDPSGAQPPLNDPYAATQAYPPDGQPPQINPPDTPLPPQTFPAEGQLPPAPPPLTPQPGGYPPQPVYPQQGAYPPQPVYPQQGTYPPQPVYPQQGTYPPQPVYPQQSATPPPYPQQPPPGYAPYPGAPQPPAPYPQQPPQGYAPYPGVPQPPYSPQGYPPPLGPQYEGDPMAAYQPVATGRPKSARAQRRRGLGCFPSMLLILLAALAVYFLAPFRTTFLVLGIDRAPDGTDMGRSDTIILVTANPLTAGIKMLSIPRDLWVSIPGVGENRINTAHFFAEINLPGSGPAATQAVIRDQFGVDPKYYVRIRFDGVRDVVDAMGGVELTLTEPTNLLPAGTHRLNGEQALAFARDRSGADDFFRMAHGQVLIKAIVKQMLSPLSWMRLPAFYNAVMNSVDMDLPVWLWPRLGLALLRSGVDGIDNRTLTREHVTSWTTSEGANVLLPNWDAIRPMVSEMFSGW